MLEFLARFPVLDRFFGSKEDSRSAARDRLRLVLVSDRSTVAPHLMEALRSELIEVISRYMEIDTCSMQVALERREGAVALAANIPVRSFHRSSEELPAVSMAPRPGGAEGSPSAEEPSGGLSVAVAGALLSASPGDGERGPLDPGAGGAGPVQAQEDPPKSALLRPRKRRGRSRRSAEASVESPPPSGP